mgnify:FL=1
MKLKEKKINNTLEHELIESGIHPVLAKIFAARKIHNADEINYKLDKLLSPDLLLSNIEVGDFLYEAILANKKIVIVGDYDADGATACACGMKGLKKFGANVDFIVPNRFEYGYGLTPEIVELSLKKDPDIILTVDNGIASHDGVEAANKAGLEVIITDHHLPGNLLPNAKFIVNPNQKNCSFPSKNLCGVGVMFYVLLALRIAFRKKNIDYKEPTLIDLLDLVALGTIADLVPLDFNNRILVSAGMNIIRGNKFNLGIKAIINESKKKNSSLKTTDLSFVIAPKINAAGRLSDMTIGIRCLLSDNLTQASSYARELIKFNENRKHIESSMVSSAFDLLDNKKSQHQYSIVLVNADWHEGVVGILASRLKEKYFRPTIAFANHSDDLVKGSGRSIDSFHLRDALDLISKRHPSLIQAFGGHAMAAGLTIKKDNFSKFSEVFELTCRELINPDLLSKTIEYDESIESEYLNFSVAKIINNQVWGQEFFAPFFVDTFDVIHQEVLSDKHTKCLLRKDKNYDAIFFNNNQTLPDKIKVVYSIDANEFNGKTSIQIIIKNIVE